MSCVAACIECGKQFAAPLSARRRVTDAQANLQQQFDRHKCENETPDRLDFEPLWNVLRCALGRFV